MSRTTEPPAPEAAEPAPAIAAEHEPAPAITAEHGHAPAITAEHGHAPSSAADGNALFVSALEALGGGALLLDDTLRVVAATPTAERLLGAPVTPGVHAVKLLCGDDVERPLAVALAAGRSVVATVRRLRPDGKERLVQVRARPIRALGGSRRGWLLSLIEETASPDDLPEQLHGMWTRDVSVKRLFRLAEKVAHGDTSVLIQGEMGTGKTSLALAIHDLSARHAGPFCAVSCASAAPAVLERALLGNAREADGGTLFLHDVEELPLDAQASLLRVIESGVVTPLDGGQPVPADIRVIATTHTSLYQEVQRGRFRADLMYRLRIVSLLLPPLRARSGDVQLLAEKIVAELSARGGRRIERLSPGAIARLSQHAWPGNVRELRAAIESAFATGEGPVLTAGELPPEIGEPLASAEVVVLPAPPPSPPAPDEADEAVRIRRALERTGGDRAQAAAILGVGRTTLWRRMRSLGMLEPGESEKPRRAAPERKSP